MTFILFSNLILIFLMMSVLWLIGTIRRDVSLVDPFWGTGFAIVTWVTAARTANTDRQTAVLIVIMTIWGIRLSAYLLWRNWGHPEDRRYAAMREFHGKQFWLVSLGTVFLLQGLIMWVVSMPIQVAISNPMTPPNDWLTISGIMLWLAGMVFETVGDFQLARFKANPGNASRVMNRDYGDTPGTRLTSVISASGGESGS